MQRNLWKKGQEETSIRRIIEGDLSKYKLGIPLNKLAQPEEIADIALFLCSPSASHVTMQNLLVDGGTSLGNA